MTTDRYEIEINRIDQSRNDAARCLVRESKELLSTLLVFQSQVQATKDCNDGTLVKVIDDLIALLPAQKEGR